MALPTTSSPLARPPGAATANDGAGASPRPAAARGTAGSTGSRSSDRLSRSSGSGGREPSPRWRFARSPAVESETGPRTPTMRGVSSLVLRRSRRSMGSLFRGDGLAADGNVPGILPYVILTFAGIVGLLLPFLELTGQGMPKLAMVRPRPEAATRAAGGGHTRSDARRCLAARAQNFRVRAPHLPSRAVAKRPVEGVHFDAGVLHGEVRRLRTRPVSAMPPVVVAAGGAPQAAFPPRPTTPRRGDRLCALVLTRARARARRAGRWAAAMRSSTSSSSRTSSASIARRRTTRRWRR